MEIQDDMVLTAGNHLDGYSTLLVYDTINDRFSMYTTQNDYAAMGFTIDTSNRYAHHLIS